MTFIGAIAWLIAVVLVIVNENYPESVGLFLLALVRWEACLLAYLASLVDDYPPFTLETGSASPAASKAPDAGRVRKPSRIRVKSTHRCRKET